MKHKHYDMIVAWAEGKTVQNFNDRRMCWEDLTGDPYWIDSFQYRIKPEPKPDVPQYFCVDSWGHNIRLPYPHTNMDKPNLLLVFEPETGKLKSAEVL